MILGTPVWILPFSRLPIITDQGEMIGQFACLIQRTVEIVLSQSKVERITSIQRELVGWKETRFGRKAFTR
jgi:hypothetical protein